MSETQVQARICEDGGTNCQAAVWVPSTEIPVSDGWFGLTPADPEYWEVVGLWFAMMALVWGTRALLKFLRK